MTTLSELPIMETIFKAEEKHGIDTHMVIEAIPKEGVDFDSQGDEKEEHVMWWTEFENQTQVFETFKEVEKFFLEEAVKSN